MLIRATCEGTNFKQADLRGADLSEARLDRANFEDAKVAGAILRGATIKDIPEARVDNSRYGDGTAMMSVRDWLAAVQRSEATVTAPG